MRLRELFEDSITSRIKDAVGVMTVRSQTTGKPYSVDYRQLARMIDYPGELSRADLESAMNNDPELAGKFTNFDDEHVEIDAAGGGMPTDMGAEMPPEGEMPTDMGAEIPPEGEMPLGAEAPIAPAAPEPAAPEPAPAPLAPAGPELVKKAAGRAAKRRGL